MLIGEAFTFLLIGEAFIFLTLLKHSSLFFICVMCPQGCTAAYGR